MPEMTQVAMTDGIAWITMDDGKVNAMSIAMMQAIRAALDEAEAARAVVVLQGRPGIFSAGFDLATFKRGLAATVEMLRAGAGLIHRLLAFPYPVLTVCTGHAYPAGAFLMMAADVRFGVAGPWRIGMNETAIGLTVPQFAVELARHRLSTPGFVRVGTAAMFEPAEALRLGYLDRVLDPADLAAAAQTEATRLCALDMGSFAATKARINAQAIHAIAAAAEDELGAVTAC